MNLAEQLLTQPDDRTALKGAFGTVDYRSLRDRSARWRGGLRARGVRAGDRVILVGGNDDRFVTAYLAVLGLGAVTVPLNPLSPPAELHRELQAVDPVAAVVDQKWTSGMEEALALGHSDVQIIEPSTLDGGDPVEPVDVDPDDFALLLFTSGTAGMPKPAILTHANLDAALRAMLSLPVDLLDADHVALVVIPLFHVFGIHTMVNLGLRIGATLVLDDYRSAADVARLVAENEVTLLGGPPTLWLALSLADDLEPTPFRSLDLAISGAAKLDPVLHEAIAAEIGVDVKEGYGLTETCAVAATAVGTDAPVGSVGRLLPGVEARLVGDDGGDVLVGDPGELWLRGPMVSPGYVDATTPAGIDEIIGNRDDAGWLHTGDIAVVDDEGNLAIVDRLKDLVIVSGFNVFPGEVESVLRSHPGVSEAAVVGEPDQATGEALVAYVVPAAGGAIDEGQLLDHCGANLARYKVPRRIEVRRQLPLGAAGKIRRQELR